MSDSTTNHNSRSYTDISDTARLRASGTFRLRIVRRLPHHWRRPAAMCDDDGGVAGVEGCGLRVGSGMRGIIDPIMLPMSRRDDADARALSSRRSSPAGASPASVSAGAPSSRPQAREESSRGPSGVSRASTEGASTRAATSREACSLDRFTTREPSRSCRGEGHVLMRPSPEAYAHGSRRGMGRSTRDTERNGTREARLRSPRRGSAARISRRRKRARRSGSPRGP